MKPNLTSAPKTGPVERFCTFPAVAAAQQVVRDCKTLPEGRGVAPGALLTPEAEGPLEALPGPENGSPAAGTDAGDHRPDSCILDTRKKSVTRSGETSVDVSSQTLTPQRVYANWLEAKGEGGAQEDCLSSRLGRFAECKSRSLAIAEWGQRVEKHPWVHDRAADQIECGAYLVFREFLEGPHAGLRRLFAGITCKNTTCPLCMLRRSARTVQAYHPKVVAAWSEGYPRRRLFFGTFTVPNADDLAESWNRLEAALRLLNVRVRQQKRRRSGPFSNLAGGVWSIETKRGRGGGWHPHAHCLWLVDGNCDFAAIQEAWSEVVGVNAWCNLRRLRAQERLEKGELQMGPELVEQLGSDLCEVLKYPMKFGDALHSDLWAVALELRKRKRVRPFGCLWGVDVPDDMNDEAIDWEAWAWVDLVFRYERSQGQYVAGSPVRQSKEAEAWHGIPV